MKFQKYEMGDVKIWKYIFYFGIDFEIGWVLEGNGFMDMKEEKRIIEQKIGVQYCIYGKIKRYMCFFYFLGGRGEEGLWWRNLFGWVSVELGLGFCVCVVCRMGVVYGGMEFMESVV